MSLVLGIDTASAELGVGLVHERSAVCGCSRYVRNSHAEQISEMVDFVLRTSAVAPADIDLVGIAAGPGSFTGLRIGIAFLKGFLFGRPTPVLPVSSLESLAVAWNGADGEIVVAFDARQDEVFRARFRRRGTELERITEDTRAAVAEMNQTLTGGELVVTDSLGNRRSTVAARVAGAGAVRPVEQTPVQRGVACALIASTTEPDDPRWAKAPDVLPRYLQPSRAESRNT